MAPATQVKVRADNDKDCSLIPLLSGMGIFAARGITASTIKAYHGSRAVNTASPPVNPQMRDNGRVKTRPPGIFWLKTV